MNDGDKTPIQNLPDVNSQPDLATELKKIQEDNIPKSNEDSFVVFAETDKTSDILLLLALEDDAKNLSPQLLGFLRKRLKNESLSGENMAYGKLLHKWWQKKYGFPYTQKEQRQEALAQGFIAGEETDPEIVKLQKQLYLAISAEDAEEVEIIKQKYIERFPNTLEGVTVLLELSTHLQQIREFEQEKANLNVEAQRVKFREFTEYSLLFMHFVLQNKQDKKLMQLVWLAGHTIAKETNTQLQFEMLKKQILTQVAAFRTLEMIGGNPKLPHPEEDAFYAIDILGKENKAFQIIGTRAQAEPSLSITTDPQNIKISDSQSENLSIEKYASKQMRQKMSSFSRHLAGYESKIGKNITGYLLGIPYAKIDLTTGEPSPELVDFFRANLQL